MTPTQKKTTTPTPTPTPKSYITYHNIKKIILIKYYNKK